VFNELLRILYVIIIFQLTHCSLQGLLCDLGYTFQLSPPGVSTRVTTRELPAAEGGTVGEKCPGIFLNADFHVTFRDLLHAMTWDRRLYFPFEGRRAEDFFALIIRRLKPGANPRTWVPKASTLPLDNRSRYHDTYFKVNDWLFSKQ
jgi:hypothetical protein